MKKWLATLLTVVMIVTLVPFSAISAFATDATVVGTAAQLATAVKTDNAYVKLTADISDSSTTYAFGKNVTIDLNGHSLDYQALTISKSGCKIIDSNPGKYLFYDYIFLNGYQAIPTGLTADQVSGIKAKFTTEKLACEGRPAFFLGALYNPTSGTYSGYNIRFGWSTNQSGGTYASTNSTFFQFWYSTATPTAKNDWKTVKQGIHASTYDMRSSVQTVDSYVRSGYQTLTSSFHSGAYTAEETLYDLTGADVQMTLFNTNGSSGGWYNPGTATLATSSEDATLVYSTVTEDEHPGCGWYGKVYYTQIFSDDSTEATANDDDAMVMDLVPAKSEASGMIGMFDKLNNVFYPILTGTLSSGKTPYANSYVSGLLSEYDAGTETTSKTFVGTASALTTALTSATDGDTVKLDDDIDGSTTTFTLPAGVTLDLNGHTFTYKALEAKNVGSRVIDSAAGTYNFYDYIYTNGSEFILTGVSSHTFSGLKTTTTIDAPNMSTGYVAFLGGYCISSAPYYRFQILYTSAVPKAGTKSTILYGGYVTKTGATASDQKSTTIATSTVYSWPTTTTTPPAADDATNTPTVNMFGQKFNYEFYLNSTGAYAGFSGGLSGNNTLTTALFDRSSECTTAFPMVLFNTGGPQVPYSTRTQLTTPWASFPYAQQGRNGWVGKTYSVSIYENEVDGNSDATRHYLPAEAPNGSIGMFDTVEGVFYPLLGLNTYAGLGTATGNYAKVASNGSFSVNYVASTAAELTSALANAIPGETVKLDADIAASTTSFTIPAGVTLDLNGHTFTYKAIEQTIPSPTTVESTNVDCVSEAANVIDSAAGEYETYEYLFVNGRQFITTGLTAADLTGLSGTITLDRPMADSAPHTFCGGYMQPYVDSVKKTLRFSWCSSQLSSGSDPGVGKYDTATANTTRFRAIWYTKSNYGTDETTGWLIYQKAADAETPTTNNLGKVFTFDSKIRDGYLNTSYTGSVTSSGATKTDTLYDRSTYNWSLNLLNCSGQGSTYSTMTKTASANYPGIDDENQGRCGWYGKVYAAKMYSDDSTDFTTNNADALVRDYVPAYSETTGMLGMFDKVDGVFYPLLGLTEYASLSDTAVGMITSTGDGEYDYEEYDPNINKIKNGEDAELTEDVDLTGEDIIVNDEQIINIGANDLTVDNLTVSAGATITGNGGTITAESITIETGAEISGTTIINAGSVEIGASVDLGTSATITATTDVTIDATAVVNSDTTITTPTFVVTGNLDNWLPVKTDSTYTFVSTDDDTKFENSGDDAGYKESGQEAASVFGVSETMGTALKAIAQDEDYQIVLKASITTKDALNFINNDSGDEVNAAGAGETLELEFDITEAVKNATAAIENLFVQFEGVNSNYMSDIDVDVEIRHADYSTQLGNFVSSINKSI